MANTIPGSGPITAYAEVIGWLLTKELSDDPQLKHTGTRTLGRFPGPIRATRDATGVYEDRSGGACDKCIDSCQLEAKSSL